MGKIYCHSCSKKCVGDVLKVGEKYFHQICFNCKDCGKTLDAGAFYFRNDNYYCLNDYTNRFTNKCFICSNAISSEVVSALNRHFHRECFKCGSCNIVFAPGNRVTMKNETFLCISCLNEIEKLSNQKENTGSPNDIFSKPIDNSMTKDLLSDDTITDQGYMSADPTSLSSPIQVEEDDLKLRSFKEPALRNLRLQSNTSRSLFDFGKFFKSSYLEIQERQEKERQIQYKKHSNRSTHSFLSNTNQHSISSRCQVKSKCNDIGSVLCGNRFSINSNLRPMTSVSEADVNEKDNVIKLASYPAGEKHPDNIPYPIERDDWPAPLSSAVLLQEKKNRKQNFFGISVQSELDKMPSSNAIDFTQSLDHLAINSSQNHQKNLLEVIQTSPKHRNSCKVNCDVISASRSPSASTEPMTKPRFSDHTDKSRSRDSTYFNDPNRHFGYSLDFISFTNRSFLVGNVPYNIYGKPQYKSLVQPVVKLKPGYTQGKLYEMKINSLLKKPDFGEQSCASNSNNNEINIQNSTSNTGYSWTANRTMSDTFDVQLKNSEYDLTFDEAVFENCDEFTSSDIDAITGLKSTRRRYSKDRIKEPTITSGRSSINSKIESLETWSFWSHKPSIKPPIISYSDLVSKDPKILRSLDAHKLETYLSSEEFLRLFKLNRSEFYRLPEWKQNDLKRRINLF